MRICNCNGESQKETEASESMLQASLSDCATLPPSTPRRHVMHVDSVSKAIRVLLAYEWAKETVFFDYAFESLFFSLF